MAVNHLLAAGYETDDLGWLRAAAPSTRITAADSDEEDVEMTGLDAVVACGSGGNIENEVDNQIPPRPEHQPCQLPLLCQVPEGG